MNMTIKEAREALGEDAANMNDGQVQELIDSMTALADIVIDLYLSLPPEERAKYRKQPAQGSARPPVPPPDPTRNRPRSRPKKLSPRHSPDRGKIPLFG